MQTQTAINNAFSDFLSLAEAEKVPRGTMARFAKAGYVPHERQLKFHGKARNADFEGAPSEIGFGGARGGGKTACVFAQIAIDDCQRFPNLKVLFLRESAGSATESVNDLRLKFLHSVEHKPTRNILTFPNNSRIILGHFQYEKDINKYLGLEYDIIVLEEATQLSATKIKDIRTCNRSSKGFRPRMYLTTNPGGIGHSWFKQDFIVPNREGTETDKTFVFSLESDNKHNNPEYRAKLEQLTGWKRKAWLDGDWDVFAGQFFDKFRYDLHTADDSEFFTPEYISKNWQNLLPWGSYDHGYRHWAMFYLAYKYDGILYVVDEFGTRNQAVQQIAEGIKETCQDWGLTPMQLRNVAAGTDAFEVNSGNSGTGESIADEFTKLGVYMNRANTARAAGASKILTLIGDAESSIAPKVKINRRCKMLIEQLGSMVHNPDKAGDVLKVNADENGLGGDDAYDAFRYLVMDDNDSTGLF